jgi:hypothetical protein
MEGGTKSVSKMLARGLAGGGWIGWGLESLLLLSRVGRGYNVAVGSVQKETASLIRGDCRARATHPSAVTLNTSKITGTCQIANRHRESLIWSA